MTHPLLAIDNLSIAFRQQGETQTVVHNLSLEVAVGETLALVGESGSGKASPPCRCCGCSLPAGQLPQR